MLLQLCLILDLALFRGGDPQAVAALGDIRRVQQQASALGDRQVTLVLANSGAALVDFDTIARATGDDLRPIFAPRDMPADQLCLGQHDRVLELTRADTPRPGAQLWQPGNVMTGLASLEQVGARLREALTIPMPRPMDPARLPGVLYLLPETVPISYKEIGPDFLEKSGLSPAEDTPEFTGGNMPLLWRFAYSVPGADWLWWHGDLLAWAPEPVPWLDGSGAQVLARDVARGILAFDDGSGEVLLSGSNPLSRMPDVAVSPQGWMALRRQSLP